MSPATVSYWKQRRTQDINEGRDCWQNMLINIHLFMKFIKFDGYLARASWQWNTVCARAAPQFVRCLLSYSACACLCLQLLHAWVSVARASVLIGVASIIYSWINYLWDARGGIGPLFPPPWIRAWGTRSVNFAADTCEEAGQVE